MASVSGIRCDGCYKRFGGVDAFARHRAGRGEARRCMIAPELRARGFSYSKGLWGRRRHQLGFKLGGVPLLRLLGPSSGSGTQTPTRAPEPAQSRERA